jgi:alkylation response protein AidB-like acyl-CoA dehydrogenase
MDFRLTDRQQELVHCARLLAREVLAKNADKYDRESTPPVDDYAALRARGYYGMLIPKEYGGWGLDLATYCLVMHELAQGATATATAFNMHNFAMWNISVLGTEAQKRRWFGEVISKGVLIGGWGSEPGAGLAQSRYAIGTTIMPQQGGYRVDGQKFFCTLAGVASYAEVLVVPADRAADVTLDDICQVIVPVAQQGVSISSDWDVLGMRATVSPAVKFDNVFVPEDHMLGKPGDNIITRGLTEAISIGYTGILCGLARSALNYATDYSARKVVGPNTRHANQPIVQLRLGELATTIDAAYALALRAGWELDHDFQAAAQRNAGSRARAVAIRAALDVTSRVFEICGGTTVASRFPLGRLYREARTMSLMSPGYDAILGAIGKRIADDAIGALRK